MLSETAISEMFAGVSKNVMENKIVKDIAGIHNKFSQRDIEQWTPDELSREAGRLAILLVNLGAIMVQAKSTSGFAEDSIGIDIAKDSLALIEGGEGVGKAGVMAKARSDEHRTNVALYKHKFMFIAQLYQDTERFISVIQSRLKTLSSEQRSGVGFE